MNKFELFFVDMWYRQRWWANLFLPLSFLFSLLSSFRKSKLLKQREQVPLPIVIVGNISVGGTGKTPLVIALALGLKEKGLRPGIISRGYGSQTQSYPYEVSPASSVRDAGDEPLLLARRCLCPVVIDPIRNRAVAYLSQTQEVDIIISDDGLQHYQMPRQAELVVIDGERGLGNGYLLPAGPLREKPERLSQVEYIVVNGNIDKLLQRQAGLVAYTDKMLSMQILSESFVNVFNAEEVICSTSADTKNAIDADGFSDKKFLAISGIGNPQRFFDSLSELGFDFDTKVFSDHHSYQKPDLQRVNESDSIVIVTEKDAVKIRSLYLDAEQKPSNYWYLKVSASVPIELIESIVNSQKKFQDKTS